jgi:peroxiredoxin
MHLPTNAEPSRRRTQRPEAQADRGGALTFGPSSAVYTRAMAARSAKHALRGACFLMVLAMVATGAAGDQDAFRALSLIKPSRPQAAKDFAVASPGGGTVRLTDYRGKVVFLNFWATWCPPCLEEMPAIERLYRKYRDRGLVVLAVSVDHDTAVVQPFVKRYKFSFPIGQDPQMALAERYGVRALPSSFFIDRRGQVAALAIGPREWDTTPAYAVVESLLK